MLVYQLAKLALAASTLLGPSVVAQKRCTNPYARREWRSMPPQERADWINAVKVGASNIGPVPLSPLTTSTSSVSTNYPTTLPWL